MNGHRNLENRYYLTRELFGLRKLREEFLKHWRTAKLISGFLERKATRDFFRGKAEMLEFTVDFVENVLAEAGGGFDD